MAKRHLTRAQQVGAFTAQNLKDAVFLRNRMGFNLAFMEDPLLTGMLAARATKGLASKIRADAIQEAQKEAKRLKEEGKLTAAARELIGPRSQRRIASPSTRPSALGNAATCGDRRGGHHGKAERKMSPRCGFAA